MSICDACYTCNSLLTCIKQTGQMERMYQAKWIPWWLHIPCGLDISLACWSEHCVAEQCNSMPADTFESLQQSSEPQLANKLSMDSACRSPFWSGSDSAEMSDLGEKTQSSIFIPISILLSSIYLHPSTVLNQLILEYSISISSFSPQCWIS
jgi:hypothetical protein